VPFHFEHSYSTRWRHPTHLLNNSSVSDGPVDNLDHDDSR
jgi:hypothetical protein